MIVASALLEATSGVGVDCLLGNEPPEVFIERYPEKRSRTMLRCQNQGKSRILTLVFCVTTFTWSAGIWLGVCRSAEVKGATYQAAYFAALCGPSLSALLCGWLDGGRKSVLDLLRRVILWRVSWRVWMVALLVPPLANLGAVWLADVAFGDPVKLAKPALSSVIATFSTILWRFGPLNEELGWRGFLLPKLLDCYEPLTATLVLAPIWAAWHLPLWALTDSGHHLWPFTYFLGILLPVSSIFTWLHVQGRGSLAPPILFHAALNTSANFIPTAPPAHATMVPFACWIGLMSICGALLWMLARRDPQREDNQPHDPSTRDLDS